MIVFNWRKRSFSMLKHHSKKCWNWIFRACWKEEKQRVFKIMSYLLQNGVTTVLSLSSLYFSLWFHRRITIQCIHWPLIIAGQWREYWWGVDPIQVSGPIRRITSKLCSDVWSGIQTNFLIKCLIFLINFSGQLELASPIIFE